MEKAGGSIQMLYIQLVKARTFNGLKPIASLKVRTRFTESLQAQSKYSPLNIKTKPSANGQGGYDFGECLLFPQAPEN